MSHCGRVWACVGMCEPLECALDILGVHESLFGCLGQCWCA